MIKSTKVSLKFANKAKQDNLSLFLKEYREYLSKCIDLWWEMEELPNFTFKKYLPPTETNLRGAILHIASKQALGIVSGTRKKQAQRLFIINKLEKNGEHKKARKLKAIYDKNIPNKPNINKIAADLNSNAVKLDLDNNSKQFDGWMNLLLFKKTKMAVPFKRTVHFNKLVDSGKLNNSIRLSDDYISFSFTIPEIEKKEEGKVLGIDIGTTTTLSCSNGIQSTKDIHNHDLDSINKKLSRKKSGSKAFKRAQEHRKNYINWTVNKLDFNNIKELRLENIKHLRKGKRISRFLKHFTYTEIFDKLEDKCLTEGVLLKYITPTYTSQRCSVCGWTRKRNRKGKQFKCSSCGYTSDADLNASINISLDLVPIKKKDRLNQISREGFYWHVSGQERIVPVVHEL